MKHVTSWLTIALAAVAMLFSSCIKRPDGDESAANLRNVKINVESKAPVTEGDSLAYSAGMISGANYAHGIEHYESPNGKEFDKEAFLLGVKTVLDNVDNEEVLIGLTTGGQIRQQYLIDEMDKSKIKFNRASFMEQVEKMLMMNPEEISDEEVEQQTAVVQRLMQKASELVRKKSTDRAVIEEENRYQAVQANKQAGAEYLNQLRATDSSVKTTGSGLVYKVEKMGSGRVAGVDDMVSVIYTGRGINGVMFDSSKGETVSFSPRMVVPGFAEALTTFPVGTKLTIYLPSDLAYGDYGSGPAIAGGETIVFDLEIVDIK